MKQSISKVIGLQVGFTTEWVVFDNGEWRVLTPAEKTLCEAEETKAVMAKLVQKLTDTTTAYIEAKVQAYNADNGLAFKDIDAFTKYAINTLSTHHVIANKFITYADNLWKAVRTYQSTATVAPTDVEFKAILDAVVF